MLILPFVGAASISALFKSGLNKADAGRKVAFYDVKNVHILGYKLLVCGFWDGVSFIPLDFSLYKEKSGKELKKTKERLTKKSKQYLHLGKCQSQGFDAQIADTTLSLIRYLLLRNPEAAPLVERLRINPKKLAA